MYVYFAIFKKIYYILSVFMLILYSDLFEINPKEKKKTQTETVDRYFW